LAVAVALPVQAQTTDPSTAPVNAEPTSPVALNYVLGAASSWNPTYTGSDKHKSGLSPVLSLQYGRFRLSSSRGNAVLNHGYDNRTSGASATLVEDDRFNLSAALGIDSGRSSSDDIRLLGLPEVRSTLLGRISAGYVFDDHWSVHTGLSQDLLGRAGGTQLGTSLRYMFDLTPRTRVGVGLGADFANSTYMRSHFGVSASASATSPLPSFSAKGGLYSVDMSVDVMTTLSHRWVLFGSANVSQLRGDAQRSPITQSATNYGVSIGLAYRCCR
jgi:outer membrane scaffolding protein for murein synthesis (MipA/OmpV family)